MERQRGSPVIHVLLAAFNEEAALGEVLNGIARGLADGDYKIWLVDDGSTDGTSAVAASWRGRVPLVTFRHEVNRGLGAALRTGLEALRDSLKPSDVLVTLDADNTQPSALIARLAAPVAEGKADVVIASRFASGAAAVGVPLFRRLTGWAASLLFRWRVGLPGVRDYTCGFRAYRGALLLDALAAGETLVTENGFACQAEWLVRIARRRPRFAEIPLLLRYDRKPTPSKMPVFRTILRTMDLLRRLKELR